jgi:tRNA dimethylallyltransferase
MTSTTSCKQTPSPLIVVIGTTGVGKTKLSVELAKILESEVVSADSMQVYRGLDIGSAKVTSEESAGVPHLLIDVCEPYNAFDVKSWCGMALEEVQRLHKRNVIPVVAGGTFLYVESLLWPSLVSTSTDQFDKRVRELSAQYQASDNKAAKNAALADSSLSLHQQLAIVDPVQATRLHENDHRRIQRSLHVYQSTGVPHSTLIREIGGSPGRQQDPRFTTAVILLDCNVEVLQTRLSDRIDKMVAQGLEREVTHIFDVLLKHIDPDGKMDVIERLSKVWGNRSFGVVQSIGFKEFRPYLEARHLLSSRSFEAKRQQLWDTALDEVRRTTVRFAKRQLRWIRVSDMCISSV